MIKTLEIFKNDAATERFGMRLSKSDVKFLKDTSDTHGITQSKVVRTALKLLKEQLENE